MQAPVIAVIAFDRISAFHLSIPCAVFGTYGGVPGAPKFVLKVCSSEGDTLATTSGFSVVATPSLEVTETADVIVVPSWRDTTEPPPKALVDAVAAASARGARVVGLCLGAYVLAEAGILDGRRATTHFAWADHFARTYPKVKVEPSVLYVDDGNITTSAGTAAGIDCCLHIVRELYGAKVADFAARRLVVPPHRHGAQAQLPPDAFSTEGAGFRLAELLDWLRGTIVEKHTADSLAERLAMSRRTFNRRFLSLTGCSLSEWLLAERLRLAQKMLETTELPLEIIAERAGLGSSSSLRQHFSRYFQMSPSAYRRQFRAEHQS
ncbi:GlxA family transcriptional regulator [Bordetella genomosp. 9]|uniref:AraC family transcriptional regulator n=1 Tax=Bordetella genomosp. 9 TaxID=1416803 RepID=A0A1W6YVH9_9BORD|nr:helix-turn-helix domain-containing protein [Bordetella genomosp. 9]ARP84994.1 AraC family transcriptional regulator [Bordetella genomosp. 9]ARP89086.1 AraC family transcriptional regulator [Bordetella genomosp. 9]